MNNNNYTEKELRELYDKAPKDIQSILLDKNFGPAISIIGKDHGLTALQSLDVENEVIHVLLGTKKPTDLAQNIAKTLKIVEGSARKIVKDIDENIFSGVKNSIENINSVREIKTVKQINTPKTIVVNKTQTTLVNEDQKEYDKKKIAIKELTKPILPHEQSTSQTITSTAAKIPTKELQQNKTTLSDTQTKQEIMDVPTPPKPKHIIGEGKIGIDTPQEEHMFEKKLRETLINPKNTANIQPLEATRPQKNKQDIYRESFKSQ